MSKPILADDLLSQLADLERRVAILERAPRVPQITTTGQGAQRAEILDDGFTASASWADLDDAVGPSVTIDVGPTGRLLVLPKVTVTDANSNDYPRVGFRITGATTVEPSDTDSAVLHFVGSQPSTFTVTLSGLFPVEGLTPGTHVVTLKYKDDFGGGSMFTDRVLIVLPL